MTATQRNSTAHGVGHALVLAVLGILPAACTSKLRTDDPSLVPHGGGGDDDTEVDAGTKDGGKKDSGTSQPPADDDGDDDDDDGGMTTDATQTLPGPAMTWTEHWFEHVQVLQLYDYNDDVAMYVDGDVDLKQVRWELVFMTNLWRHARASYGEMSGISSDPRLYVIFHTNKYTGCHSGRYYESQHDFRNVVDCGWSGWAETDDYAHDGPTDTLGLVVGGANSGLHGTPYGASSGDWIWTLLFRYDGYQAIGLTNQAQRAYTQLTDRADTFPRADTHWFRDWFYPLWRDYGHAQVMARFFKLNAKYFPNNGDTYSRSMTWGEFVHFMSGAAHKDLLSMAHAAFGTEFPTDDEFAAARGAFPQVTY